MRRFLKSKKGSKNYDASIDVHCENDECGGQAKIILYKKATNTLVQVFKSDDLTMYLDEKQKPSVNVIQLYDEQSALTDSFQDNLLSPPIYTRPAEYKGLKVPEILLSGNLQKIQDWLHDESVKITQEKRPDLLE